MNTQTDGRDGRGARKKIVRIIWIVMALVVAVVGIYSVHVATYEADPQDTVVIGQSAFYSDAPVAIRILVRNFVSGEGIRNAKVQLTLIAEGVKEDLGEFFTDETGTISESVHIGDVPPGRYTLEITSKSSVGKDAISAPVEIRRPYRIYVTTDKPVYQPGQMLHVRTMILNSLTLKPFGGEPVTIEVEDPKGNKVFRKDGRTSDYGIASADFAIADEVNLGRYRVRVVAENTDFEKIVTVKRYVLPRFKTNITTDEPYYLPGQTVEGQIQSQYFFGKPVAGADVEIVASTIIEKAAEVFRLTGKTDSEGVFAFSGKLGDYFTGMPLAGKKAFLRIEATVTDTAGHEEMSLVHLVVAPQPIDIQAIPESGRLVAGVENYIYIAASYPDGRAAQCRLSANNQTLRTDKSGIAILKATPVADDFVLNITATDSDGRTATYSRQFALARQEENLLLRTDKAVYAGGETINATVLSTAKRGTFFLDVIKQGQTMLTRTLNAHSGRAALALDLPPSLSGTLKLNAYMITSDGRNIGGSRIVHVVQAGDLKITAATDRDVYRPGEVAKLNLTVTGKDGRPLPAALGLAVVDEAVFSVSENRPGLIEQFFLVDQQMLAPIYQTRFTISPQKFLQETEELNTLALAMMGRALQPQTDDFDLSKLEEYVGPRMIERMKQRVADGTYDDLLKQPEYAHLAKILKPADDYSLRITTHRSKHARTEERREKYFHALGTAVVTLVGVVFVVIVVLASSYSTFSLLRGLWVHRTEETENIETVVYNAANALVHAAALLVVFPLLTYCSMVFMFMNDMFHHTEEEVILITFLINLVVACLLVFTMVKRCLSLRRFKETRPIASLALLAPVIFMIQYVITRTIFLLIVADRYIDDEFMGLTILATVIITPLLFLIARQIAKTMADQHGVALEKSRFFAVVVALILAAIVFGAVLMPSLNKVKKIAQRVVIGTQLRGLGMAMEVYANDYKTNIPDDSASEKADAQPRIRKYFPETLFWQPEVITDDAGRATIEIPLADSITNWIVSADALSMGGQLGSTTADIRVFQDFFVDLDLPVVLTRNDEIAIPVVCYNYLDKPQSVSLTLQPQDWFESQSPETVTLDLGANEVASGYFRIKASRVGTHRLTVTAKGSQTGDAIQRQIRVSPDGTPVESLTDGTLTTAAEHTFEIPAHAIADSQQLLLKFYPSTFSEIVEGLDGILRMPSGCFEQTSSAAYPNVMALLYMKNTNQVTPEIEIKARKFITAGYQRLLTFEVAGGGFDWFGHPPANELLTAYGVLEFTDMAKVHNVDPAVIDRASRWLASRQNADGSWSSGRGVHTWNAVDNKLMATAYIAWALAEAGHRGPEINKALSFLRSNINATDQSYTLALAANAFCGFNKNDPFGRELVRRLHDSFIRESETAHITSTGTSATYSTGACLEIETTALATLAIIRSNQFANTAKKALTWLSQQKDSHGTWHSTQATILAMKALIAGTGHALPGDSSMTIQIDVNGQSVDSVNISPANSDLLHTVSLTQHLRGGANTISIEKDGDDQIAYRLVGAYWVPQAARPAPADEELTIDIEYDRTSLAVDDTLTCTVDVTANTPAPINMAIIDLGIPPGFAVDAGAFEHLIESGMVGKYELTSNQCILYVRNIQPKKTLHFEYRLTARYPIRAKAPAARVYEYYNPQNEAQTQPVEIVVE